MSLRDASEFIRSQELRVAAAKEIARIAEEFPGLIDEFMGASANGSSRPVLSASRKTPRAIHRVKQTQIERVTEFFNSRKNEWSPASDIIAATGINRGGISNVLYTSHKDRFEHMQGEHGNAKLFRLRPGSTAPEKTRKKTRKVAHGGGGGSAARMAMPEAVLAVLKSANGGPLKTPDIVRTLREQGYGAQLRSLQNSVFSALSRRDDIFEKVAAGEWRLKERSKESRH